MRCLVRSGLTYQLKSELRYQANFLIEAVLLSSVGALAGLLVGAFVGNLVIEFSGGSPLFTPMPVVLAIGSALLIGLVFGYAPARRAAHMHPARALTWE